MLADENTLLFGQMELVAAYVLLAALLLSITIWNRVRWWIKAATIVITCGFFFISFLSVRQILGWPTNSGLPDRFELIWAFVEEPDETARTAGGVYVWAMTLPGSGSVDPAEVHQPGVIDTRIKRGQLPRAYKLPYTRYAHEDVEKAITKMVDGVRQIGVTQRKPKKPGEHDTHSPFTFFDRPDPILPPK